ncbi:P-II family nitrogen regulator [Magnetospira sp. QH-2]|uniref:P-II family nitrogen regulator n=1 Tax=Magnetospira sp. (strain QH-2) TaxID=1288970 RepID=UPI0003E81B4A
MKLIIAIIKPTKIDEVQENLRDLGITGATVTEVRGYGRQKGQTEIYRGAEYHIQFVPKLKLEIAVPDEYVESTLDAIQKGAHTDKIGDGKIFVIDMEQAMRIRTGETDREAL